MHHPFSASNQLALDNYLALLHPSAKGPAFSLAEDLRQNGFSVAADWEVGSLKSRMKRADKAGAAKVVMIGEDELRKKEATVRDLATREQTPLDLAPYLD